MLTADFEAQPQGAIGPWNLAWLPQRQVRFCQGLLSALKHCKTSNIARGTPVQPPAVPPGGEGGSECPCGDFSGVSHPAQPSMLMTKDHWTVYDAGAQRITS